LYLVGELHQGGLERQLYYLVRAMDRDRYSPAVAVWNYVETDFHIGLIEALGVPVYPIAGACTRLGKLAVFRRLVADLEPEVVHSYSFHTNFAASWATTATRSIAIGSIRNDFDWSKGGSGPLLGRLSGRWPGFHISNSHSAAAAARESCSPFAPRRCEVVTNGIDLERFRPRRIVMDGPAHIVGVGYLRPEKRWDRLLRASHELQARYGLDHRISICGGGSTQSSLRVLAEQLGIANRVTFMDHVDDIPGQLAASTFVVLTSEFEGYPNAVMEAMACGRAVVATDVGDVRRLIDDGQTGLLVRSGDGTGLVNALATLIQDRDRCAAMGAAGRQKAETQFGLDRFVRQTLSAYRDAGWQDAATPTSNRSLVETVPR
jgi:glycosyltransferase involved in cell wall biosynthesis